MCNDDKLIAKVPVSWEKSFSMGVVFPHKLKKCNKSVKCILCDGCDKLINQKKNSLLI